MGHGYRLRAAAIRGDVLLPCFYVGTPTSNSVRTRHGTRGLCRLLHRPGGLVRARRRWACRGPVALATKMPANAGRRGDLAPTHELTCAGELQRAMVLEVKALTAPGTFAKVAVVYPAKEKKAIKALHAVCDASRMLAEVNIPKRSDWAGGGTMVGGCQ